MEAQTNGLVRAARNQLFLDSIDSTEVGADGNLIRYQAGVYDNT